MSLQRLLCKHLLNGRPGREPTSAVVDGVDVIEFLGSSLVRSLVVAQHAYLMSVNFVLTSSYSRMQVLTSSIDGVVDPSELLDSTLNEMVDLLCARDVCLHS